MFGWIATLNFLNKIGITNIESKIKKLGDYVVERLHQIGCKVLTPLDKEKRHGLIVYTTGKPEIDESSVVSFRNATPKPIIVSRVALGGIEGIRVATHFFNTIEDIEGLIENQKKFMS